MAVGYNPRVVTDGLVLSLDAGNPKNYNAGISTNWTDKVGGNNGTLVGGTYHNDGPFVGAGYVEFDGDSDSLTVTASTDFTLDGEFTVEFWIYLNTIVLDTQHPSPITFSQSGGNKGQIYLNASNNYFSLWNGSSNVVNTGNNSVTTGRWYHVAVTRDSSDDCRIFLDGVLKQTASSTFTFGNASGDLRIGSFNGTGGDVNGNISNLRILKGTALYTSNFTPPTKQLTAVTNTVLLTCQGNTIADASSSAHTITANGNAAANLGFPASAFEFDGTDDYVITTRPNSLVTGGSISVSLWAKWTTTGTSASDIQVLVDNNHSSSPAQGFVLQDRPDLSKSLTFSSDISANGVVSTFQVGDGTWHHIVGTNDQITTKLYIDGSLDAQTSEGGLATVQPNITIGYWQFTPGRLLNGNIAQVSIYNRALTALEIQQNFNATRGRFGI